MESSQHKPARQHTVPGFYLKKFRASPEETGLKSSQVWMYMSGNSHPVLTNIEKSAVQRHFYTREHPDGSRDYSVENLLAKIESDASISWSAFTDPSSRTPFARYSLAIYIAAQWARTARVRHIAVSRHYADVRQLEENFEILQENYGIHGAAIAKIGGYGFHHFYADSKEDIRYNLEISRNERVALTTLGISLLLPTVRSLNWWLVSAPSPRHFITSDAPVAVSNSVIPPVLTKQSSIHDLVVTMPISPLAAILGTNQEAHSRTLQALGCAYATDWINTRTAANALRQVYSYRRETWIAEFMGMGLREFADP